MSDLKFIYPDWLVPNNVKAVTSSRLGGVSQTPFDSLNVGMHVHDQETDVQINRQMLTQALRLPNQPIWLDQIHSSDVIELGGINSAQPPVTDGALTQEKNVVCSVMTADCLPLFLCNQAGNKVALIHVGWRGLAQGIIERAVTLFNEPPENIIAWAGPCISVKHFEVGAEVRKQLGGVASAYRESHNKGKFYVDLYRLSGERLAQQGINNYAHSEYCTYENTELFFSHRRDQGTGRMVSLIWFE